MKYLCLVYLEKDKWHALAYRGGISLSELVRALLKEAGRREVEEHVADGASLLAPAHQLAHDTQATVDVDAPGLGRLVVDSIENRDFTTVQGAVLTITLVVVLVNVTVDVLYTLIDPRISVRSSEG